MELNTVFIMVIAAGLILWRRMRATSRPVKGKGYRLLLPLLFLALGLTGLLNPELHLTVKEVVLSLLCGAVLSIPMILTTNYERREDGLIYPKKKRRFRCCPHRLDRAPLGFAKLFVRT